MRNKVYSYEEELSVLFFPLQCSRLTTADHGKGNLRLAGIDKGDVNMYDYKRAR